MAPISFAGDVHGKNNSLYDALNFSAKKGASHVIQVGDFWCYGTDRETKKMQRTIDRVSSQFNMDMHVWFCDGNHEDYTILQPHKKQSYAMSPSVTYVPRGVVETIEGYRIGFFGGAESKFRSSQKWFEDEIPTQEDKYFALENMGNIDILVSHECSTHTYESFMPHIESDRYVEGVGISERDFLDTLIQLSHPKFHFHGHYHTYMEENIDNLKVVSLANDSKRGSVAILYDSGEIEINPDRY